MTVEKQKRGEGPLSVQYVDHEGQTHKRVPEKCMAVRVFDKNGKYTDLKGSDLPPAVINQLAMFGIGKKVDVYGRNTLKNDESADVIGTAKELFDLFKSGSIYTRGEGKGPAAKFDLEDWVDTMVKAAKLQKQPLDEKKVVALRTTLMSLQGRERQAKVLSWTKNPYVKQIIAMKKISKTGGDNIADMF